MKSFNLSILQSCNRNKGFTLIEVLIYTVIFSVVSGLMAGILTTTLKINQRESSSGEVNAQLDFVLQTIQRLTRESSAIIVNSSSTNADTDDAIGSPQTRLILRMKDSSEIDSAARDPIIIYAENNAIKMSEGRGGYQRISDLTSSRVLVDKLEFIKRVFYPGHDTVSIDIQLTYNSQNPQARISRKLSTSIARVSAATFDSNLLPGSDNQYEIGYTNTRWKNISISNLLNLGQLSADPVAGMQDGSIYYNTANKIFRGYSSSTWSNLGKSYWNATGTAIYYNSGNVGIGTSTPNNLFQVYDLISFPSSAQGTFLGYQTGKSNTTGSGNTFVGYQALYNNTAGQGYAAVGYKALYSANAINNYDIAIGYQALSNLIGSSGGNNVAVGYNALYNATTSTAYANVAMGNNALYSNISGNTNIAIGYNTLYNTGNSSGNIAIGSNTLYNSSSSNNVAVGFNALYNNICKQSSCPNNTGANVAIGSNALYNNIANTADSVANNSNIAIGSNALYNASSSAYEDISYNVALGNSALYSLTSGMGNIAIGYQAGDNITTGDKNIIIGYDIDAPSATSNQQLSIGNLIFGTGLDGWSGYISSGKIGIGTNNPQSTFHIPDGKYAQFEDNNVGAPLSADCDSDSERGRLSIDTLNNYFYYCNGQSRGWDYAILND